MTFEDYLDSEFRASLISVPFVLTETIDYTEEEKANDKAKALIGCYTKAYSYKEAFERWWGHMSKYNKRIIISNEYFDKDVFNEIAGQELIQ